MTQRDDNNSNGQFWPGKANKIPDCTLETNGHAGIQREKKKHTRYAGPQQHNKQVVEFYNKTNGHA